MDPTKIILLILPLASALNTSAADALALQPIHRRGDNWIATNHPNAQPDFHAVIATELWPPGLIPIFVVPKKDGVHLRRYPLKGQEGDTDPAFFAFPLEGETVPLNGRWTVTGLRAKTRHTFTWELATHSATNLIGRFDQHTDFRYGSIAGGAFNAPRFRLRIEYIMDTFHLTGELKDGQLKGAWTNPAADEHGAWEATQEPITLPPATNLANLYEWQTNPNPAATTNNHRHYSPTSPGPNWVRSPLPLARISLGAGIMIKKIIN